MLLLQVQEIQEIRNFVNEKSVEKSVEKSPRISEGVSVNQSIYVVSPSWLVGGPCATLKQSTTPLLRDGKLIFGGEQRRDQDICL